MYCRVVKQISIDVSEVRTTSIIRAMSEPCAKRYLVINEYKWTELGKMM
jgi:hypothetical protein